MTIPRHILSATLALILTLPANTGWAGPPVPKTVEEAREQMETSSRRPSYRTPPGNVRAEDYRALFGNTVMVVDQARRGPSPSHQLMLVFIGSDGRYLWCAKRKGTGKYKTSDVTWRPLKIRRGKRVYPLFDNHAEKQELTGLSPLYDVETGEAIWYTLWRGRWWDWNIGHLQERLPASTWDLCPDFPSAEELGVGINRKQTAITYDKLLEQNPGRRILRPDLVTPDPIEVRE